MEKQEIMLVMLYLLCQTIFRYWVINFRGRIIQPVIIFSFEHTFRSMKKTQDTSTGI